MFRNLLSSGVVKAVGKRAASTESVSGEWIEKMKEDVNILKGRSAPVQLVYATVGGTAVTSCLGICGFVRWQAGILDEKLTALQTEVSVLSKQQAELIGQLKLLIGALYSRAEPKKSNV